MSQTKFKYSLIYNIYKQDGLHLECIDDMPYDSLEEAMQVIEKNDLGNCIILPCSLKHIDWE